MVATIAGAVALLGMTGLAWASAGSDPSTTHVFAPTADAYVYSVKPGINYGAQDSLRTDGDPAMRAYLRFDVTGLEGPVIDARIRLYTRSASPIGWALHLQSRYVPHEPHPQPRRGQEPLIDVASYRSPFGAGRALCTRATDWRHFARYRYSIPASESQKKKLGRAVGFLYEN